MEGKCVKIKERFFVARNSEKIRRIGYKKVKRNIFVLTIAKISNPFESFTANIWVTVIVRIIKTRNISRENNPKELLIMKNQKENPAVIASALNLDEERSILNRIDKCNQTTLC